MIGFQYFSFLGDMETLVPKFGEFGISNTKYVIKINMSLF